MKISTPKTASWGEDGLHESESPGRHGSSSPDPDIRAAELVKEQPASTWRSYVWDTLDKSPEERRFLFKLDTVLLTFASLGYLIKYLDQVNINNAFVSGMKEDMKLFGNELNYMQTCWTVGYVIGQIPRSDMNNQTGTAPFLRARTL